MDTNQMTTPESEAVWAAIPPDVMRVYESLTVEQLEVLCAPGATLRDLPELTDEQVLALVAKPPE